MRVSNNTSSFEKLWNQCKDPRSGYFSPSSFLRFFVLSLRISSTFYVTIAHLSRKIINFVIKKQLSVGSFASFKCNFSRVFSFSPFNEKKFFDEEVEHPPLFVVRVELYLKEFMANDNCWYYQRWSWRTQLKRMTVRIDR